MKYHVEQKTKGKRSRKLGRQDSPETRKLKQENLKKQVRSLKPEDLAGPNENFLNILQQEVELEAQGRKLNSGSRKSKSKKVTKKGSSKGLGVS